MKILFSKRLMYFLLCWLVCLGLAQLFLGGEVGYQSSQAAEIEEEIQRLEKENSTLEEKIASYSSLQIIEKEAKNRGLVKETLFVNYSVELPVALRP